MRSGRGRKSRRLGLVDEGSTKEKRSWIICTSCDSWGGESTVARVDGRQCVASQKKKEEEEEGARLVGEDDGIKRKIAWQKNGAKLERGASRVRRKSVKILE